MEQISILGCGWLGFPLAQQLLAKGFSVNGSTTSPEKLETLEKAGINAYRISVSEHGISGDLEGFLKNASVLVIDIPPKLRGPAPENFTEKITQLLPFIEKAAIKKILFVSSTSVYADLESMPVVTEMTRPDAVSASGKQLAQTETILQQNPAFKTTVLRFGGLIGEDRHPVRHLAGKENLENPDGPINLIHLEDCLGIILKLIGSGHWGETFNAVAPFHPSREIYYSGKAIEKRLLPPVFSAERSVGKIINSDKIRTFLGYQFNRISDF